DERTLEMATRMKEAGLIRKLGATSHHRKVFPVLARQKMIDLFHVRYNAINRGAEKDVFPFLESVGRPGVVSFTATRWGKLIDPKKTPPGKSTTSATDAYRFVLSNPAVDVCMAGARNIAQMRDDLKVLELGPMNEDELIAIRATGDYLYAH
ncbi:MAG TPA: hypothetical protein VI583_07540, partial [Cyclobacteriaceae bacterium]|nr:hypothetical protein [Cyclobacteriaceae bacterium]